ncbi:MAG: HD domain-containing protein, partial [Candidatus Tectomicrobia bacterium]|nr:HD domain-containing protein [Candidatus Tectomicrobia bacterium]
EDQVLRKPGRLTEEEMEQMKAHPKMGSDIMEHIRQLHAVLPGMRHHHERYDGKGYPDGLKGEENPLQAMIISVADTLDAMTSDRPYRKALSFETAYEEICRNAGTQLSERVVEAFKEAFRKGKIVPLQKVLSTAC